MDSSDIAPMVVAVMFIVSTAAVVLLRPIIKRLGTYLEVLAEERRRALAQTPMDRADAARLTSAIDSLENRLALLEEHQDFTNRLLAERPEARSLPR